MAQPAPDSNDKAEQLRAVIARADARMQGQLAGAIGADQRALVFAGLVGVAAAAIGGAAATLSQGNDNALTLIAMRTAAGLVLAMILAVIAARPVAWFYPGSNPASWFDDIDNDIAIELQLRQYAEQLVKRVDENERTLKLSGRWLMTSAVCAIISLFWGGLAWVLQWGAG